VTSPRRVASLPDIPTIAESGVPGYDAVGWFAVFAPAKTPQVAIAKLNTAIVKYVKQPDTAERLAALGAEVVASSPEQFGATLKSEMEKWGRIIKAARIQE